MEKKLLEVLTVSDQEVHPEVSRINLQPLTTWPPVLLSGRQTSSERQQDYSVQGNSCQ